MNANNRMGNLTRTALLTAGLIAAISGLNAAQAQEWEYAQKSIGTIAGNGESTQFRSTIIDPARPGKATMPESSSKLRVIPFADQTEVAAGKLDCNFCGIVESISMSLRGRNIEPDSESAFENITGKSARESRWLPIREKSQAGSHSAGNRQQTQKQAPFYEIKVRMADGTLRIVNQPTQPEYGVGDYVRVISGAVTAA